MEKLNVKVGDKVIVKYGTSPDRIAVVTKITPTGRIRIDNRTDIQFTPDGVEMKNRGSWSWTHYLCEATTEEIVRVEQDEIIRKAIYRMQNFKKSLSYADAVEILKILEK